MSFLLPLLAATACGTLSGFGIGGGSLMVLYLTAIAGVEQKTAQGLNLLFFLPAAATALLLHGRNGLIKWRVVLPALLAGVAFGLLGAWLAGRVEASLLRHLFGVIMILLGAKELLLFHTRFHKKVDKVYFL